ncbi:MAG: hypothetical protein JXA99_12770 [Candidatus Lokiarchaeota archaeon]|nr:hypothetical protein [Candidatus Lokiarchaeota archaeon]
MKLRDILNQYTIDELKAICMNLKISGYGRLDKQRLVELLDQSMSKKNFIIDLFKSLSDLCIYFISLISKTGRKEIIDKVKIADIPYFSLQMINDTLKKFYIISLIFLREDKKENAVLTIPDDILPWFKEFFIENQMRLRITLQEIVKLF